MKIEATSGSKPILSGPEALIRGYQTLQRQEDRYTAIALNEQTEIAAVWYRYLSLYDQALRADHETDAAIPSAEHTSWEARLRFLSTGVSSVKLSLDASLAGYYSQALAIIRHMFETWRIVVYIRVNPQAAINWFPINGIMPQAPRKSINSGILSKGSKQDKNNLNVVLKFEHECDDGSHPSVQALYQVETGKVGFSQIGANFIEDRLIRVMSLGTLAVPLLLDEVTRITKVSDEWLRELKEATDNRTVWCEQLAKPDQPLFCG